ncbi:MAG: MFS transporter [Clostridia bacterium]|nr:MFS transporter [Clostridia bacterium]
MRINLKDKTTKEILAFSLMPFGMSVIYTLIGTALNMYFTDVLGLSLAMTSIVLSATKIWDAINDPIMGMIVDKTHTKLGKCRPYIFWMSGPVIIVTALLFAPVNFCQKGNFIFAIIAYLLYYTVYTALDIPYQGLTPLVFPEDKKRVKAVSFSNILGSLGSVLPSILFFTVAGFWGRDNQKMGYFGSALIFAVLAGIPMFLSGFGIKEKVYIPPKKEKYFDGLKIVFKDKKFVCLVIAAFFSSLMNIGSMFLPYFAKWNCAGVIPIDSLCNWIQNTFGISIQLTSEGLLTPLLQVGSGLSYMISMAIVPVLLKKTDKKTLWIGVSLAGIVADILCFIIGVWVVPYNTVAGAIVYTVIRFFTNFPVGMITVLLIAMFSDVIDDLEMRTGKRLEGTVFSFRSLVGKVSYAAFNVIMLNIVDKFGYNADLMTKLTNNLTKPLIQSTTHASVIGGVDYTMLLNVIFFMLTALGAVGLLLQTIPMFFYKFDEKAQEGKLKAFREEKEAKEKAMLNEAASMAQAE